MDQEEYSLMLEARKDLKQILEKLEKMGIGDGVVDSPTAQIAKALKAMTPQAFDPNHFPLMRLPRELRDHVYEQIITENVKFDGPKRICVEDGPKCIRVEEAYRRLMCKEYGVNIILHPITLANKEVRNEFLAFLYREYCFFLPHNGTLRYFLKNTDPFGFLSHARKLALGAACFEYQDERYVQPLKNCKHLTHLEVLLCAENLMLKAPVAPYTQVTNLADLRDGLSGLTSLVVVDAKYRGREATQDEREWLQDVEKWLGETALQPRRLGSTVDVALAEARPNDEVQPERWFAAEFDDEMCSLANGLKIYLRDNRRRVLPNSREIVADYNRTTYPDTISKSHDATSDDWTELPAGPSNSCL